MATLFTTSCASSSSSSRVLGKNAFYIPSSPSFYSSSSKLPFGQKTKFSCKRLNLYVKAENKNEPSSSAPSVAVEERINEETEKKDLHIGNEMSKESENEAEEKEKEKQQEMDWKTDEEFKKFMGNPSIEAAIKLEKKRADRKLKELGRETSDNPLVGLFNKLIRDSLSREKERLEQAEETFKALDLNKVIRFSNLG